MRMAALRYRVMAYITGVLIIVVCFAGIPLQLAAHNTFIANDIGHAARLPLHRLHHLRVTILAQKLKMKLGPTIVLAAGRHGPDHDVLRRAVDDPGVQIAPALAAESAPPQQQPVGR